MSKPAILLPSRSPWLLAIAATATSLGAPAMVHAQQSGTWALPTGGAWSNPANWTGGLVAEGAGFGAIFNTDISGETTVQMDAVHSLATLTFGDTDAATTPGQWTVTDNSDPLNVLTLDPAATVTVNAGTSARLGMAINGNALTKNGTGVLVLTGANTIPGAVLVADGTLRVGTGGTLGAAAATSSFSTSAVAGTRFIVDGGTVTAGATCTFQNTGLGFLFTGGNTTVTTTTTNSLRSSSNDGALCRVDGGVLKASSIELRRSSNPGILTTTDVTTASGFYMTGGDVEFGAMYIATNNSAATARVDGGNLTVTGQVQVGLANNTRNSILQINGGTFTSTDTAAGVILGARSSPANPAQFYITGGVSTVEKISLGISAAVAAGTGNITFRGGSLYLGSGGIVKNATGTYAGSMTLGSGLLGAKASWTSPASVAVTTGTDPASNFEIKAADAAGAPNDITIAGIISGAGGLTKTGGGRLILTGENTWDNTGGAGTVIAGGTLQIGDGGATGLPGNGPLVNNATLAVNRSGDVTLAQTITGTGSFVQTGPGTTSLTGDNLMGSATVSAGTLLLQNTSGSATGTGAVTVQTGATLGGAGSTAGAVTVQSGGIIAPGSAAAPVGTLTAGSLTLAAGSELHYEFSSTPANDQIAVTGNLAISGGAVRLRQAGTANPWSALTKYYLIRYGTLSGAGVSALSVAGGVTGLTYTFGTETVGADNFVTLTISSAGTPDTWNVDADGTWSTAGSWSTGVPGGAGSTVNFLGAILSPRTITLDSPRTAGALVFDNGSAYTLTGAALTLNNNAAPAGLSSFSGQHTIQSAVSLPAAGVNTAASTADSGITLSGAVSGTGAVRHTGPGSLTLSGANSFTGGLGIASGTVRAASAAALSTGAISWTGTGTLQTMDALTIANSLSIPAGVTGRVDTAGSNSTLSGSVSGAGMLAKTGAGELTLSAANTHSGGTLLDDGMVRFSSLTNLGTGALAFDGGGLIWNGASTADISGFTTDFLAGGAILQTGSAPVSLLNSIGNSGTGGLTKQGAARLTLGGANTYAGRTRVLEGELAISSADNLGTAPATAVADQLTLNGGTLVIESLPVDLTATRGIAVGDAIGAIEVPSALELVIPGAISDLPGTAGVLNLLGEGTVTLNASNSWTGGGAFGALIVNANATNALGLGPITLNGTTLTGANNVNLPNAIHVDTTATLNFGPGAAGTTFGGPVSGSGVITLNTAVQRGSLNATWSAFSGTVNIAGGGECRIGLLDDMFTNAKVDIGGTSQLVLAINPNVNVTRIIRIGQLTGTGSLGGQPVPGRMADWVVGGLGTDSTFDGIIKDNMSQSLAGVAQSSFSKDGSGTLTLTGASTYTGTTRVLAGRLLVNGDNSAANGAVTVASGATLGGTGTLGGAVTVENAGVLAPGASIESLATGSLTLDGALEVEYAAADPGIIDTVIVTGDIVLGATSELRLQPLAVNSTLPAGPHVIATSTGTVTGTFASISGLPAGYIVDYAYNGNSIALVPGGFGQAYSDWAAANGLTGGAAQPAADPDADGHTNAEEFALDSNPASPADSGKVSVTVAAVGAENALVITLPVRAGTVFTGAAAQAGSKDGIAYTIQGSDDLSDWTTMVISEVTPAISAGLPALSGPGWTYRSFRTPGPVSADSRDFLRVRTAPGS